MLTASSEGVIWKQLLLFFFPILLGTFFQQLYNTVDTVIVGRFVGDNALAAVGGTTSVVINLLVGFFVGLSSGATVVISQYFGAGDYESLDHSVHTSAALSLAGGAVITVLGLAFSPMVLRAMNTPEEVLPLAIQYIEIYFAGSIAVVIYNIGSGILRALGNSRLPLFFLIICCLVNIVLDLLFVLIFHWGVMGVAVATLFSQVVSAILTVIALCHVDALYRL
ncbi:MAG: MATE family efflux transporter, partial [Oscillospiraceae bacterium]